VPKKRNHLNFCRNPDCRKAFEIKNDVDYCDTCRIIDDLPPGEHSEYRLEDEQPEIVKQIMKRYMVHGYE